MSTVPASPLFDSTALDASINDLFSANPVAGMSVAIVQGGTEPLVWSGNYGLQDIESGTPVTDNTSFWLGSVSKLVMGAAMMIAREKGFLDLDDEVQALLNANGDFSIDNPSV
ncbi:beta-lactamase family protein [Granulosicoccus sp.]|nr:beta-lactamase family protein [Granulosicoccus sp.]